MVQETKKIFKSFSELDLFSDPQSSAASFSQPGASAHQNQESILQQARSSFPDDQKKERLSVKAVEPSTSKRQSPFTKNSHRRIRPEQDRRRTPVHLKDKPFHDQGPNIEKPQRKIIHFDQASFDSLKKEGRSKLNDSDHASAIILYSKAIELGLDYIKRCQTEIARRNHRGDVDGALKEYGYIQKMFYRLIPLFYDRGVIKSLKKDYQGSLDDFQMVVKYQPENLKVHFRCGVLKRRINDLKGAEEAFTRVIQINPEHIRAYYNRARIHQLMRNTDQAISDYKSALKKDPGQPNSHLKKALFLSKKGDKENAIRELDKAINKTKDIIKSFHQERKEEGENESGILSRKLGIPLARFYLYRGDAEKTIGMLEEAERDYSSVILLEPSHIWSYIKRGEVRAEKKDFSGAIQDWSFVLEKKPGQTHLHYKLGLIKNELNDWQGAANEFSKILQEEPYNIPVYLKRGQTLAKKGDLALAEKDFSKVIEFKSEEPSLYYQRGMVRHLNRQHEGAREDIRKAIQLDPEGPHQLLASARSKEEAGDFSAAVSIYSAAILKACSVLSLFGADRFQETLPISRDWGKKDLSVADSLGLPLLSCHFRRGLAYLLSGQWEEAIQDFTSVIEHQPAREEAYLKRGEARRKKGDIKESIKDFNKALELNPKNDMTYMMRGLSMEHKKDMDSAIKDYSKAIKLNPLFASHHTRNGMAMSKKQLYEGALFSLSKAISLNKNEAEAYHGIALIQATCPVEKYRDRIKCLENASRAVEIDHGCVEYLQTLAIAYSINGKPDKALELQEKIVQHNPSGESKILLETFRQNKSWYQYAETRREASEKTGKTG